MAQTENLTSAQNEISVGDNILQSELSKIIRDENESTTGGSGAWVQIIEFDVDVTDAALPKHPSRTPQNGKIEAFRIDLEKAYMSDAVFLAEHIISCPNLREQSS